MKTCHDSFAQYKPNRNTYLMRHVVVQPRYTNMKNQSEISWQFPAHPPPQGLRNYNDQAKRISFQIAQARRACLGNKHIETLLHLPVVKREAAVLIKLATNTHDTHDIKNLWVSCAHYLFPCVTNVSKIRVLVCQKREAPRTIFHKHSPPHTLTISFAVFTNEATTRKQHLHQ